MKKEEIFEEVKVRIDKACKDENFQEFDLSDLGFDKEDVDDGRLIHFIFKLQITENKKIEIDFRSYDQSGPFQNLKDMNKFNAELIENDRAVNTYKNSFED